MSKSDNHLNTVAATKQVSDDKQVLIVKNGGKIKLPAPKNMANKANPITNASLNCLLFI